MNEYNLKMEYLAISHENTLEACNNFVNFYLEKPPLPRESLRVALD